MKTKYLKILLSCLILLPVVALHAQPEEHIKEIQKLSFDQQPGFMFITELTGAPGIRLTDAPYAKYFVGITAIAGYQFARNIRAGAGTGFQFHNQGTFLPLFLDLRYSFNARDWVPFIDAAGGMAINLADPGDRLWLYINPSAGIKWLYADKRAASFSAGLYTMSGTFHRNSFITLRLGLELKSRGN